MGINEELGLPFGDGMEKFIVAFDVDGTLIGGGINEEHWDIVDMAKTFSTFKNVKVVVWSGGGKDYAATIGYRLGLDNFVWKYMSKLQYKELSGHKIIAIDDVQDTRLGDVNLIVRNK